MILYLLFLPFCPYSLWICICRIRIQMYTVYSIFCLRSFTLVPFKVKWVKWVKRRSQLSKSMLHLEEPGCHLKKEPGKGSDVNIPRGLHVGLLTLWTKRQHVNSDCTIQRQCLILSLVLRAQGFPRHSPSFPQIWVLGFGLFKLHGEVWPKSSATEAQSEVLSLQGCKMRENLAMKTNKVYHVYPGVSHKDKK